MFLNKDGFFFSFQGIWISFFETEETHAVMPAKDSPFGNLPSANSLAEIPQGEYEVCSAELASGHQYIQNSPPSFLG